MQNLSVAQLNVPVGRVVYTSWLDENGGFRADLTVMRLAEDRFRVVTGGATGMSDAAWIRRHLPPGAFLADLTSAWTTIGLWGPRARDVLAAVTADDASHGGSRSAPAARSRSAGSWCSRRGSPTWASSAGNCTCRSSRGCGCGTPCGGRAAAGLVPAGIGVYGTTGRLEKGYRAFGAELTADYTLVEAGMTRPKVKPQSFIGKDAYLRQRSESPCAVMCTLTVDSHESADGSLRYMLGGEPVLSAGRRAAGRRKGRPSYVTSAGSGPSVGKHLLMAYLPAS